MKIYNLLSFIILLFFSAVLLKRLRAGKAQTDAGCALPDSMSPAAYRVCLYLVFLIAVAVRLYRFGMVPGGMNQDGAMAAVDAKALADYGTDRLGMPLPVHFTAWGFGQMSVMMSYLMVPFIKLFGLSVVTARLPSLIISLISLSVLYLLCRDSFGRGPALAVIFIAALSPWHIMQSRWALDCNLFPHFFLFGMFFLNRGISGAKVRKTSLCLSMLSFALSMYCYGISLYTVPLFLLADCILLLARRQLKPLEALMCFAVYILFAWPFFAVMLINFLGLDTVTVMGFTLPAFPSSVRSSDILFFSENSASQFVSNLRHTLAVLLQTGSDLPWNCIEGFGTLYLFSLPLTVYGGVYLLKKYRASTGCQAVLLMLLVSLFSGLITADVNINRINLLFYPLITLTGLGLYSLASGMPAAKIAVPAIFLGAFIIFSFTYFTSYSERISYYFMQDFGEAVSSVKDSDASRIYITADSQYDGASNVSTILTLFYHDTDAKYYQGETPDGEIPFREKYCFRRTSSLSIDPGEDAVYIVTVKDCSLFDPELFRFEFFGSYAAVYPK